jgi:hypothetical protein
MSPFFCLDYFYVYREISTNVLFGNFQEKFIKQARLECTLKHEQEYIIADSTRTLVDRC